MMALIGNCRYPVRTLFFSIAMTAAAIAGFIASVHCADILAEHVALAFLSGDASHSENVELFSYATASVLGITWVLAVMFWKQRSRAVASP